MNKEEVLKQIENNNLDINEKEKIRNLFIINTGGKIKKYENIDMAVEDILNKLKLSNAKKENIKKIEKLFFKYEKRFDNLEEKLKTDEKLRKEFFIELEEILNELPEAEKEEVLKQIKEHNNKINNVINYKLDNTNLIELFFIDIPLMFLNNATKSLVIINNNTVAELKKQYIKNVNEKFKINLEELTKEEVFENFNNYFTQEIKNPFNSNNIQIKLEEDNKLKKELEQLKNENKQLKEENKQLKTLSNKLLKQTEKLEQNIKLLDRFVETELITTIYEFLNEKNPERKEKLEKQLEQQLKYKPAFTQNLSM